MDTSATSSGSTRAEPQGFRDLWQAILQLCASHSILRTLKRERLHLAKAAELAQNLRNIKDQRRAMRRTGWKTDEADTLIEHIERAVKGHERYTIHYCRDA